MANYAKILAYQSAMTQALYMLQKGIITTDDIVSIEDKLARKYRLQFGSIYREIDLLNVAFRANMV